VATIAWVGYEPPATMSDLRVVSDDLARAAAPQLTSFFNGLDATTVNPRQDITAFGHSYGSLVTSLALQGGTPVKGAVFYGSPGLELAHASDLHLAPGGHAYYEQAVGDPIDWVQREPYLLPIISPIPGLLADWLLGSGDHLQRFGDTPNEMPDITQLSTSPGADPMHLDEHRAGARGHAEYARTDRDGNLRMSGYNLAAVLSGVAGAPKTGN
jgi:pimeloyl-ACP methyl ester carboxylesterase